MNERGNFICGFLKRNTDHTIMQPCEQTNIQNKQQTNKQTNKKKRKYYIALTLLPALSFESTNFAAKTELKNRIE